MRNIRDQNRAHINPSHTPPLPSLDLSFPSHYLSKRSWRVDSIVNFTCPLPGYETLGGRRRVKPNPSPSSWNGNQGLGFHRPPPKTRGIRWRFPQWVDTGSLRFVLFFLFYRTCEVGTHTGVPTGTSTRTNLYHYRTYPSDVEARAFPVDHPNKATRSRTVTWWELFNRCRVSTSNTESNLPVRREVLWLGRFSTVSGTSDGSRTDLGRVSLPTVRSVPEWARSTEGRGPDTKEGELLLNDKENDIVMFILFWLKLV